MVAGAPGTVRVRWPVRDGTTVSILIPFRDEPRLLRTCVDSVTATTRGQSVELVLIDNGSSDPETATLVELLGARPGVRVLHDARPFNWAQLNNAGARVAGGDVLVFLNNDIEAHREGWLTALCGQALRPDVAAAGARLLYPDRRLQHCGLVVGLTGAAGHPLAGLPAEAPGYLDMATVTRECAAVTGACLATRREVFDLLGGFDETLGVDLNDVDYCLRAGRRRLPDPLRACRRAAPPRVAEPRNGRRRRRHRQLRRPVAGVHCGSRPLLQPAPHSCRSVVRSGRARGRGDVEPSGTRP